MDHKKSKKSKYIIQKYVSSAFKNVSLDFYGIQTAKIKELKIHTVVIYAANVKNVDVLDMGTATFNPTIVLLKGMTVIQSIKK